MKKKLLMALGVTAVAAVSVNTTLAYLEAQTDTKQNVYELGNVSIKQLEYERVVDENGAWVSTGEKDKYGYYPEKLQEYTDSKPLLPAVFLDGKHKWDDRNGSEDASGDTSHQQSWAQVGASGSNQLFDSSMKNVQDHFVFVENDGKSNAYVRTWFAFEQGSIEAERFFDIIEMNMNMNHWDWVNENDIDDPDDDVLITIPNVKITDENGKESTYMVLVATYKGAKSNPNGILAPTKVSYPNLLQVYMQPGATSEDVVALDGNGNGKYDVLVKTQAIQVDGFPDAETALNTGFGENHPF